MKRLRLALFSVALASVALMGGSSLGRQIANAACPFLDLGGAGNSVVCNDNGDSNGVVTINGSNNNAVATADSGSVPGAAFARISLLATKMMRSQTRQAHRPD